jgi:hypothetical protein
MVDLPWRRSGDDGSDTDGDAASTHTDAVAHCECQDGTLAVYDDRIVIERVRRSKFADKTIPVEEITGVDYDRGITVGYIQIEQVGVPVDSGGLLSDPINENTLHFGRGRRADAAAARDAILERAQG